VRDLSRAIGLLSGKGGVGKTTVAVNLGAALTHVFKKNVVIFDTNVRTSHLGLHLGMYEDPPVTLRDVFERGVSVIHAIYVHPSTGIRIIPAPLNGECGNFTRTKIRRLVNQIRNSYDMVLLDCAPGLGKEVVTAISAVDEALVVTTPDLPAVTDAMKTLDLLRKMNKNVLGIVLNRCEDRSYMLKESEIESACNCSVISKIPEDKKIPESISRGIPVVLLHPNSAASKSLKNLAGYLAGEIYREENLLDRIKNFLGFGKALPLIEKEIPEIKQVKEKEIVDVEKIKTELAKEVREELKKEIIEGVRKRLREKYAR
jgi:septum site-determining protein MinD